MTHIDEPLMREATLERLNNLSSAQNMLVLLRSLNTSDLTFQYMLYTKETIKDIASVALSLLVTDQIDQEATLTVMEMKEFNDYISALEEYYA